MLDAWGGGVAVLFSSDAQESRKADAVSKIKNLFDFVAKMVLNIDVAILLGKIRLECLYNFGYFASMTLLERSMFFFYG